MVGISYPPNKYRPLTQLFRRKQYMGACDQKTTESILDFFYDQGGMCPFTKGMLA